MSIYFSDSVSTCGFTELGEALYQLGQSYPEDSECAVLFTSAWCPDCVRAEPAVRRAFVTEQQRLLVCDVGTREAWKASTPVHSLRNAPWALTCIPSLVALDGWAAGQPARAKGNSAVQPRLDSELESCTDPDSCQELVEEFIAERRLGDLGDVVVEGVDEEGIPIGPAVDDDDDDGGEGGTAGDPSKKKGSKLPVAQISAGVVAIWITAGMLMVVLHEHHHHTHNKRNKIERNFEYFLQMVIFFSPVALVALFGYLRNRHWDRVAGLKNL